MVQKVDYPVVGFATSPKHSILIVHLCSSMIHEDGDIPSRKNKTTKATRSERGKKKDHTRQKHQMRR
jgi:hypothetical protein